MERLQYDPPMATKLVVLQSCGVALDVNPCSVWNGPCGAMRVYMSIPPQAPLAFLAILLFPGNGARNACWHFLASLLLSCHP
jgi:hypothetical protein